MRGLGEEQCCENAHGTHEHGESQEIAQEGALKLLDIVEPFVQVIESLVRVVLMFLKILFSLAAQFAQSVVQDLWSDGEGLHCQCDGLDEGVRLVSCEVRAFEGFGHLKDGFGF